MGVASRGRSLGRGGRDARASDKKSRGEEKSRGTRERASKILEALCRVYLAEREREKEREYEHTDRWGGSGTGGGGGGGHYEEELRHDVDDARDKGNDGKEEAEASTVYYFPG